MEQWVYVIIIAIIVRKVFSMSSVCWKHIKANMCLSLCACSYEHQKRKSKQATLIRSGEFCTKIVYRLSLK